jgi:hypothetical protein
VGEEGTCVIPPDLAVSSRQERLEARDVVMDYALEALPGCAVKQPANVVATFEDRSALLNFCSDGIIVKRCRLALPPVLDLQDIRGFILDVKGENTKLE